eukprot:3461796-Prorocentrum_lima.AAC.1
MSREGQVGRGACRVHHQQILFGMRGTWSTEGHNGRSFVGSDINWEAHESVGTQYGRRGDSKVTL